MPIRIGCIFASGALLTDPKDREISAGYVEDFKNDMETSAFYGRDGQRLTIDNLGQYIVDNYLVPDANRFLTPKTEAERQAYLSAHPWVKWDGTTATFTFEDFGLNALLLKIFDWGDVTYACSD